MAVETNINEIDKQGKAEKVLSDYQVHTISIVGEGALGINLTKVKSTDKAFLKTEGGQALMAKVEKAKALEAEQATEQEAVEQIEAPVADVAEEAPVEQSEEVSEETEAVESVEEEKAVEANTETPEEVVEETEATEEQAEEVVEEEKVEEPVSEEATEEVVVKQTEESESESEEVEVAVEGEETEKAKAYTSDQLIQIQKDALDGVHGLVKKLQDAVPDADLWQITDLVYNAIWKVEDAIWAAEDSKWDEIYTEVYQEVNERVNKAKALKVQEAGDMESKLKALEAVDPELAVMMKAQIAESKAKTLEAETERKALIRAKALEQGAEQYKRIATEDNTTDNIVDAMIALETTNPEVHAVIAKALETASNVTMAGNLFRDVGTSEQAITLDPEEFVESKAKALVDKEGGNLAAARATVRQSEEYVALFG